MKLLKKLFKRDKRKRTDWKKIRAMREANLERRERESKIKKKEMELRLKKLSLKERELELEETKLLAEIEEYHEDDYEEEDDYEDDYQQPSSIEEAIGQGIQLAIAEAKNEKRRTNSGSKGKPTINTKLPPSIRREPSNDGGKAQAIRRLNQQGK